MRAVEKNKAILFLAMLFTSSLFSSFLYFLALGEWMHGLFLVKAINDFLYHTINAFFIFGPSFLMSWVFTKRIFRGWKS